MRAGQPCAHEWYIRGSTKRDAANREQQHPKRAMPERQVNVGVSQEIFIVSETEMAVDLPTQDEGEDEGPDQKHRDERDSGTEPEDYP